MIYDYILKLASTFSKSSIEAWIKDNVQDPKNNCFFYSAVVSLLFPGAKLMKGWDRAHFYVVYDGEVIDPGGTKKEIGEGDEEVSALKNVDEVINDPLFDTLSDKGNIKKHESETSRKATSLDCDTILKLASIYCFAGVEELLNQLGVREDVKAFIASVPQNNYRYYIPLIRNNPQITITELQAVEIPEERAKADPYEEREHKLTEGYSGPFAQWALIQFRKARKGLPIAKIRKDDEAYYLWWRIKDGLSHIYDWYRFTQPNIASFSFEQASKASEQWHEAMASGGRGQYYTEGAENIIYGPKWKNPKWNGWTIRKITTGNDLEVEGNKMNHCVGGYCKEVSGGYSDIYSLRDPKNEPHVTMEATGGSFDFSQLMGNSNEEPDQEYKDMIAEWFRHIGPDKISLNDDYWEDKLGDLESYNLGHSAIAETVESLLSGGGRERYGLPIMNKMSKDEAKRLYFAIVRGYMGKHSSDEATYPYMYEPIDLLAEQAVKNDVDGILVATADKDLDQLVEVINDDLLYSELLPAEPSVYEYESEEDYEKAYKEWEEKEQKARDNHYEYRLDTLPYSLAYRLIQQIRKERAKKKKRVA